MYQNHWLKRAELASEVVFRDEFNEEPDAGDELDRVVAELRLLLQTMQDDEGRLPEGSINVETTTGSAYFEFGGQC